jgi:hypothetical protein
MGYIKALHQAAKAEIEERVGRAICPRRSASKAA